MPTRLFTVGCSYTSHDYPTWADFLSSSFDEYENWGRGGFGNRAVFNRLIEIIYKKNITPQDTIVVQWSTPVREDRWYRDGGWKPLGNIYNQSFYSEEWVEKYFDPFMGMMETINYAIAAQKVLDSIGCKWTMTWMTRMDDITTIGEVENTKASSFLSLCDPDNSLKKYIDIINGHEKMLFVDIETYNKNLCQRLKLPLTIIHYTMFECKSFVDPHPNPVVGYHYAKDVVCPMIGINDFDPTQEKLEFAQDWLSYLSNYPRISKEPSFLYSGKRREDSMPRENF